MQSDADDPAGWNNRNADTSGPGAAGRIGAAATALLVVLVAGLNLVHSVRTVPPPPVAAAGDVLDAVARFERRLAPLREALRARGIRGTIGYVGDLPPDAMVADGPAMEDYFRAQSALVPCVLDARSGTVRWAVANLRATRIADRLPAGFRVAVDCGGGVLLLEGPP